MLLKTVLFLSCLYLLYLVSSAAPPPQPRPPPRPIISETFTAEVYSRFVNIPQQFTITGEGHIGRDYGQKKQVVNLQMVKFGFPDVYYELKRSDMNMSFTITENYRRVKHCQNDTLWEPFGLVWSWVYSAMYAGIVSDEGIKYETWNYTVDGTTNSLWVRPPKRRKPARYIIENQGQNVTVLKFKIFVPKAPDDPNEYDIPNLCIETPYQDNVMDLNLSHDFDDAD